jgi:hypothetical protein
MNKSIFRTCMFMRAGFCANTSPQAHVMSMSMWIYVCVWVVQRVFVQKAKDFDFFKKIPLEGTTHHKIFWCVPSSLSLEARAKAHRHTGPLYIQHDQHQSHQQLIDLRATSKAFTRAVPVWIQQSTSSRCVSRHQSQLRGKFWACYDTSSVPIERTSISWWTASETIGTNAVLYSSPLTEAI